MTGRKEISAAVLGVLGGGYHLLTGFLDPTFLFDAGLWYPAVKIISRQIGPAVIPEVPWELIGVAGAMVMLAGRLYQLDKQEEEKQS